MEDKHRLNNLNQYLEHTEPSIEQSALLILVIGPLTVCKYYVISFLSLIRCLVDIKGGGTSSLVVVNLPGCNSYRCT